MTRVVSRISAGVPSAMSAELEDVDVVADARAPGPCRGRSAGSVMPCVDDAAEALRRARGSRPCRGRRPARPAHELGCAASARATPTACAGPGRARRHAVDEVLDPEHVRAPSRRVAVAPPPGHTRSSEQRRPAWRSAATSRFSSTVRSSNSSSDCQVRREPGHAAGAAAASDVAAVEADRARADEAGDGVDERRLAGAVRADQADDRPWPTFRSTSLTALRPPKRK